MHRIEIKNFGPIKHVSLDIKDFNVFIGPQASGKSTIAKLVYFFRSLRDMIKEFLREDIIDFFVFKKSFVSYAEQALRSFFDPSLIIRGINVKYIYKDNIFVELSFNQEDTNDLLIKMSPELDDCLQEIFKNKVSVADKIRSIDEELTRIISTPEKDLLIEKKSDYLSSILKEIDRLFDDDYITIYLIAGRAHFVAHSAQIKSKKSGFDASTKGFIDIMLFIKTFYQLHLELARTKENINERDLFGVQLKDLQTIMNNILRGQYSVNRSINTMIPMLSGKTYNEEINKEIYEDRIYYDQDHYVTLEFASSGQQEIIIVLLIILYSILKKWKVFLIIEEPEAHLYPIAQKEIMDLIVRFVNSNNNQVMITTHSPYILTATNNLLYASKLAEKRGRDKVREIVPEESWLDVNKVNALFLEDGIATNIVDEESGLIRAEEIDRASGIINQIFERLFDLDD